MRTHPMNTATKKTHTETKDTNVRDRLRLVGDVQEGMSITKAAKNARHEPALGLQVAGPLQGRGF